MSSFALALPGTWSERAAPSSQGEVTPPPTGPQAPMDNELLITFKAIKATGHFLKDG